MAPIAPPGSSRQREFRADLSEWPLVRIYSPRVEVEVDSFFRIIDSCLERHERFACVHDIRGLPSLNAIQRKRFSDYIKAREFELKRGILGHAVVVNSGIEKGIVTAVLWVSPTPFPVKVFDSPVEAEKWVRGLLRGA